MFQTRVGNQSKHQPAVLIQFNGKTDRVDFNQHQSVLNAYRQDLEALHQWNQSLPNPVFLKLDMDKLIAAARRFITERNQKPVYVPHPFMIGIAGGTASGKTTIKKEWVKHFEAAASHHSPWEDHHGPIVDETDLDSYYQDTSTRRKRLGDQAFFSQTNLDEPGALDLELASRHIQRLKRGEAVRKPSFSYPDSARQDGTRLKLPTPFYVVEGLFTLLPGPIHRVLDMKVFVAIDKATQSERWWNRVRSRGVPDQAAQPLYDRAFSMHDTHVEPTRQQAEIVINGNANQQQTDEAIQRLTQILLKHFYPPSEKPTNAVL